jgi:hypothetical protein
VINVSLNCLLFIFAFVVRVVVDVSTAGVFQTLLVAILQKSTRYSVCIFNGLCRIHS